MSDMDLAPENVEGDALSPSAEVSGEKKSSGGSKVVIIAVALGVLAIVAGIVLALVLFVFGNSAGDSVDITVTPNQPAVSSGTTETAEAAQPADAVANSEVFTFRDIFEPLIVLVDDTTTTTTTTDTANTTTTGTLYLLSVEVQDGNYMAVLSLNGVTYTLGDGERVGDTPWQVVTVREDSVVMIYGETQVVLTIGQGITK
ncbi:MAG: hypothetical protein Q7J82_04265 [Coriobacteriia bacterium]|nr:hypothetical protein [Coriobacteriia bacterium]